mmetsp:Transcript_18129/g.37031  ORF Transcript_18129/g.37031 Transcript_18129/m.37031 type:complete len:227 (-) Transcript_18129:43-723(-)
MQALRGVEQRKRALPLPVLLAGADRRAAAHHARLHVHVEQAPQQRERERPPPAPFAGADAGVEADDRGPQVWQGAKQCNGTLPLQTLPESAGRNVVADNVGRNYLPHHGGNECKSSVPLAAPLACADDGVAMKDVRLDAPALHAPQDLHSFRGAPLLRQAIEDSCCKLRVLRPGIQDLRRRRHPPFSHEATALWVCSPAAGVQRTTLPPPPRRCMSTFLSEMPCWP